MNFGFRIAIISLLVFSIIEIAFMAKVTVLEGNGTITIYKAPALNQEKITDISQNKNGELNKEPVNNSSSSFWRWFKFW
ncbi:hypothetical protein ACFFRR_003598 [Megaselia abdita]